MKMRLPLNGALQGYEGLLSMIDLILCTFLQNNVVCNSLESIEYRSRGISGSIVSDNGLDDWGSIPNRGRGFFF
jgi:hypothetical protein